MPKPTPTPIPIKNKKRSILIGPISCNGIRRVLAAYKCVREEKRIAKAMFDYFEPTQEQKDLIGYRTLTEEEKIQARIPAGEERITWNDPLTVQEDIWSVELTDFEWAILRSAMSRYTDFSVSDEWEVSVWEQIEDKPDDRKKAQEEKDSEVKSISETEKEKDANNDAIDTDIIDTDIISN